ncbi:stage II sporulation protein D [Clostridium sp.]|uniref:stage II sporulation protein D n=1 Tax=Clostridium sp. TaxID=1506 RepID=UPI001A5618AD|nr:stage II sporulation protein D [Clostridium sp.]MBK5240182.1 stage II sporulation protein D [Clostridium sp.]
MRRAFITKHLKNFLLLIVVFTAFIVITSLLIVGDNKSTTKKDFVNEFEINESATKYVSLPKISSIKVLITKENIVREINLEEYVTGVVASEMPAAFDIEALKAQAVASRTYALAHISELGGAPCKNGKGADLCDTVHCQVYKTKDELIKVWEKASKNSGEKYFQKIKMAVESTSGQVLTYNSKLVMEPYYFATSSGKTENSEDVFSSSVPYLKSVESPGEERAGSFKSSNIFKYSELNRIINNNYNNANVSLANIKEGIKVIERSEAGSVKLIKVGSITMTGSKFRTMLGLKSSNFEIVFNLNDVEINCSGYGHGVGMSQWGADAMAKSGKNYNEILNHYYSGTVITK